MKMKKIAVHKMAIGHKARTMMAHPVRSEPARSSGGHSMHAAFPLAKDANHIPKRPHVTMSSKVKRPKMF